MDEFLNSPYGIAVIVAAILQEETPKTPRTRKKNERKTKPLPVLPDNSVSRDSVRCEK